MTVVTAAGDRDLIGANPGLDCSAFPSGRNAMKAKIHPEYVTCKVTCACGNAFETRSTRQSIKLDICAACHPFFTGSQKFVDTAGRVDKFRRRYAKNQPSN